LSETLTKQPTLGDLKLAGSLLDESIRQSKSGTKTHLDHLVARCRLDVAYIQTLQKLGLLPLHLGISVQEKYEFKATSGLMDQSRRRYININPKTIDAVE